MRGRSGREPRGANAASEVLNRVVVLSETDSANLDFISAECSRLQAEPVTREDVVSVLVSLMAWSVADAITFAPREGW